MMGIHLNGFRFQPNEQKLDSRRHYATLSTTSHDGDSGRGDSDPDAPASDVIQDFGK